MKLDIDIDATAVEESLRAQSRDLLTDAITTASEMLKYGSPTMKLNVIKAIMPTVGKVAVGERKNESEEMTELRGQLEDLTRLITGKVA